MVTGVPEMLTNVVAGAVPRYRRSSMRGPAVFPVTPQVTGMLVNASEEPDVTANPAGSTGNCTDSAVHAMVLTLGLGSGHGDAIA